MAAQRILVVDDDPHSLSSTCRILEVAGYEVVRASDGLEALSYLRDLKVEAIHIDLILSDVRMPRMSGLEFLQQIIKQGDLRTPVILMTAFGNVEDAVWAMKAGAIDFLTKPFKRESLLSSVSRILKLKGAIKERTDPTNFWGTSFQTQSLLKLIDQVGPTLATVLITGESGTGKELVAKALHAKSARAHRPWIAINCAAIPENLLESELFGFEKGSFTGANQSRIGLFEAASGGTLFLDEIGDMPLNLQAKLLRVVQESEVQRVGSHTPRKVDVRLIAASHRNLNQMAKDGLFRQDLLYRLEVIKIAIPPLRERVEDILTIAEKDLEKLNIKYSKNTFLSTAAKQVFEQYAWPGNVRELHNALERAVVLAPTGASTFEISLDSLPSHFGPSHFGPSHFATPVISQQVAIQFEAGDIGSEIIGAEVIAAEGMGSEVTIRLGTSLREIESILLHRALKLTKGDKEAAAKLLGIAPRTVYRKLSETQKSEAGQIQDSTTTCSESKNLEQKV